MILGEEQTLLWQSAKKLFAERSPAARVRTLRGDPSGFSRELYREVAAQGFIGCHLPEELGGVGLGFFEQCLVLEAAGRSLVPEPIGPSVVAATALALAGTPAQTSRWLPALTAGDSLLAFAHYERDNRYDWWRVAARFHQGKVSGVKHAVPVGQLADAFVVLVRIDGSAAAGAPDPEGPHADSSQLALALVQADANGVSVEPQSRIDGRPAAIVRFEDAPAERVGDDTAPSVLEAIFDQASIALAAEMLGGAQAAFDLTLEYLKTRQQFGVPIGSFQALQHRAARLFTDLELARSSVLAAARAVDESPADAPALASLAKATCSDTFTHVTNEAVQMHGGIGVTDDHDIGLYLERARAADATLGDAAWHRKRWARVAGY